MEVSCDEDEDAGDTEWAGTGTRKNIQGMEGAMERWENPTLFAGLLVDLLLYALYCVLKSARQIDYLLKGTDPGVMGRSETKSGKQRLIKARNKFQGGTKWVGNCWEKSSNMTRDTDQSEWSKWKGITCRKWSGKWKSRRGVAWTRSKIGAEAQRAGKKLVIINGKPLSKIMYRRSKENGLVA